MNLKLQIIRVGQGHWSCTASHYNSYFCCCTYEKTILGVHFTKGCFCQFVDRNVVSLMLKYYLLAGDTRKVSIFFLI